MFRILDVSGKCILGCALALALCGLLDGAYAQKSHLSVLYSFTGGSNGGNSEGGLILDKAGNLYGTTYSGGGGSCHCGTVFKLAPNGTETVLYAFTGTNGDGGYPAAGLILDKAGNLYGTTLRGGVPGCPGGMGCGTVFKLAPNGTETVLYAFTGANGDGDEPYAGVISDKAGNLYGTTGDGGGTGCLNNQGCGTVFKLAPDGTETVLHAFSDANGDGGTPLAGLIMDKAGNLYGTTYTGGAGSCPCGTAFKVAPDGTETVLHTFTDTNGDGAEPYGGVILDKEDNLYGTTYLGGGGGCGYGCGIVFKLAPDGTETVLHAFTDTKGDGGAPSTGLIMDKAGNLYGTTERNGVHDRYWGTVFKLAPDGTEKLLHTFRPGRDGHGLVSGLIADTTGNLYSTTLYGGAHGCSCGTVFKLNE